jgi:uncharacterized protein
LKRSIAFYYLSVFIFFFTSNNLLSQESAFPKPIGYVNDFEHIFTKEENQELENIIADFENKTTNEIAIVTTDNIGDYTDFEKYAFDLSNEWGVGKKGKDNGMTIVFSNKLRKIRINTGTQTGKIVTNEICDKIMNEKIIPEFKKGEFFIGVKNSLLELIKIWGN